MKARPFRLEISGSSMEPTLLPGDWVLATRGRVSPGDVVVLEHPLRPGVELVKRVAADPADDTGRAPLGRGRWYVLGDAPDRSTDSRHFGAVPGQALLGTVRLIYWPPRRWGSLRPRTR